MIKEGSYKSRIKKNQKHFLIRQLGEINSVERLERTLRNLSNCFCRRTDAGMDREGATSAPGATARRRG